MTEDVWAAELRGLRELLAERDRRYGEQFTASQLAVKTALDAAEKAVTAAFEAAKEAVLKTEVAEKKRSDATELRVDELSSRVDKTEGNGRGLALGGSLVSTLLFLLFAATSTIINVVTRR
jgi:hypothetical protein